MRVPLIAGNWKMNLTISQGVALAGEIARDTRDMKGVDILVAPPFTALDSIHTILKGTRIILGAQNIFFEKSGAYTGEIAPDMLLDAGCTHVIIGHSERREYFKETNEIVNKKTAIALSNKLIPIVCVGETLTERESGSTNSVIKKQVIESLNGFSQEQGDSLVVAYEPVWAIGTGKTASPEQANEVHILIRKLLAEIFGDSVSQNIRILYGGSVKPENAEELLSKPDIDGALVGGASLKAETFVQIVNAAVDTKQ